MKTSFLFFVVLFATLNSVHSESKNVLIIHSYHQGLNWTDSVTLGIMSVLNDQPNIQLYFEYMDSKRNNCSDYLERYVDLYKSRSSKINYDAIITVDNAAYDFMLKHRDEFYPGTPVFYCGVNYLNKDELNNYRNIYGYEENADHKGTIDLIRKLFPDKKKILIVNDYTLTGKKIFQELQAVLPIYKDELSFEIMDTFNIEELKQKISTLSNDYAIYLLVINMDRDGNYISYNDGIDIIKENTQAPIFGSWDFYMGRGIVGGQITRGFDHGKNTAQLAYNYLSNNNVQPPKYQLGKTRLCIDTRVLAKYEVDKSLIPKGTFIINKNKLAAKYAYWLKICTIILVLLLLLFTAYYVNRKNNEKWLKKLVNDRTLELQKANERLIATNQSKNEILGIVAHDLRNPIGNINGFAKLIIKEVGEKERNFTEIIINLSDYMLRLTNNLLDIAVIESGELQINKVQYNYASFIKEEVERNTPLANQNNITLQYHCVLNEINLFFDKMKIQQVLNNLISNALKHSTSGGIVSVSISVHQKMIQTIVKDTGAGISKENIDRVFNKFTQLQTPINKTVKGTGLGLSIAKGIIEAHGGIIYVKSELNKGSEFIFELPLHKK